MNILLTGCSGFVGSHLAERLLRDGHRVLGVDNYISGQPKNTLYLQEFNSFSFYELNVSQNLPELSIPLDWVLHFASPASPPHYQEHPVETLMVGAQGTQNCLELSKKHEASFMLASTSEVYGTPLEHPQTESYWGNVNPNGLRSCYDEAKRYAEAITMAYHRHYSLDTRIIRIFNTYGPRMRADDGRVVTNFIHQALSGEALTIYGDGSQTRSFQYIDDLVEGIIQLMNVEHHEPVNLGNPDEYSIFDFARIVRDYIKPDLPIVFKPMPADDPTRRRPDISKAKTLLAWQPSVSLSVGLSKTVDYFKQQLAMDRL